MANYQEIVRVLAREATPRRVMWVCGDIPVLVEDVVDRFVAASAGERINVGLEDAWDEIGYSTPSRRCVIVRGAERMSARSFARLGEVLRLPAGETFVCFVSSEKEWRGKKEKGDDGRWRMKFEHEDVREALVKRGRYVVASLPVDRDRRKKAGMEIFAANGTISRATAEYLYEKVGGDIEAGWDVLRKCRYFDGEISSKVIDVLAVRGGGEGFVEYLMRGDRGAAASVAGDVERGRIGYVLRRLEKDVAVAGALNRATRNEERVSKAAEKAGVPLGVAMRLSGVSRYFDAESVGRRLMAIAACAEREGALEELCVRW